MAPPAAAGEQQPAPGADAADTPPADAEAAALQGKEAAAAAAEAAAQKKSLSDAIAKEEAQAKAAADAEREKQMEDIPPVLTEVELPPGSSLGVMLSPKVAITGFRDGSPLRENDKVLQRRRAAAEPLRAPAHAVPALTA